MSSPLAIASVTIVLKNLLDSVKYKLDAMEEGNLSVTALPPDRIDVNSETNQLNIFMYQATANPGWRNQHLPAFNHQGSRTNNPPLALDLHYLLCAYGASQLSHDILLGYGMQVLHEFPVLTPAIIQKSMNILPELGNNGDETKEQKILSASGLDQQIESIKISPENLSMEEISRLWTAFGAKYRPNATYKATVVLIQEEKKVTVNPNPEEDKISIRVQGSMERNQN
ncbi:MAG: DUF4255 domain-containing protein [Bacteroidetes bacterium]|nr:DUF4255 domain-containing protein [Bacteroidota bacterium]